MWQYEQMRSKCPPVTSRAASDASNSLTGFFFFFLSCHPCDENPQWPSNSIYIWISMRNSSWYGSANSLKYWKNGLLLDVKLGRYGFMVWGGTYCYKTTINLSFAAQVIALLCR